jgi:hypothetical protein
MAASLAALERLVEAVMAETAAARKSRTVRVESVIAALRWNVSLREHRACGRDRVEGDYLALRDKDAFHRRGWLHEIPCKKLTDVFDQDRQRLTPPRLKLL